MKIWAAMVVAVVLSACASRTLCEQSCDWTPHVMACVDGCELEREHHEEIGCQPDYDRSLECRVAGDNECADVDVRACSAAAYGCSDELAAVRACSADPECVGVGPGAFSAEYSRRHELAVWCESCGRSGVSTFRECPYDPTSAR